MLCARLAYPGDPAHREWVGAADPVAALPRRAGPPWRAIRPVLVAADSVVADGELTGEAGGGANVAARPTVLWGNDELAHTAAADLGISAQAAGVGVVRGRVGATHLMGASRHPTDPRRAGVPAAATVRRVGLDVDAGATGRRTAAFFVCKEITSRTPATDADAVGARIGRAPGAVRDRRAGVDDARTAAADARAAAGERAGGMVGIGSVGADAVDARRGLTALLGAARPVAAHALTRAEGAAAGDGLPAIVRELTATIRSTGVFWRAATLMRRARITPATGRWRRAVPASQHAPTGIRERPARGSRRLTGGRGAAPTRDDALPVLTALVRLTARAAATPRAALTGAALAVGGALRRRHTLIVLTALACLTARDADASVTPFARIAIGRGGALIGAGDADAALAQFPGRAVGSGRAVGHRRLAALAAFAARLLAFLGAALLGATLGVGADPLRRRVALAMVFAPAVALAVAVTFASLGGRAGSTAKPAPGQQGGQTAAGEPQQGAPRGARGEGHGQPVKPLLIHADLRGRRPADWSRAVRPRG